MGTALDRYRQRKSAYEALAALFKNPQNAVVVHYSCESFYDRPDGRSARITSIAARHLDSGQTKSFSIHKIAELKQVPFGDVSNRYDELEREMLAEFFRFAEAHQRCTWMHWNMRDINYGFQAPPCANMTCDTSRSEINE